MRELNILYIINVPYKGGVEKFTIDLIATDLANHKYRPYLLFLSQGELSFECKEKFQNVLLSSQTPKLTQIFSLIKFNIELYRLIKEHKIDVVHIAMPWIKIVASAALILSKVKVLWFQHGPIGNGLDRVASLLPYEDMILFNSKFTQNLYHSVRLLASHAPERIMHPMATVKERDDNRIQEIRQAFLEKDKNELWVCAGRINAWKGFELAIEALAQMHLSNVQLVIIGSVNNLKDQEYASSLTKLVEKLKLESQVTFLPYQKHWQDFAYACDLFLHTSRIPEPFGLVIAEAMLCGAVVVGSSLGGAGELILGNETGFSFDSSYANPEALTHLIFAISKARQAPKQQVRARAKQHILNVSNSSKVSEEMSRYLIEITG